MFDWWWSVLSVISFYCKTWGAIRALSGSLMVRTNLINAGYCSLTGLLGFWWSHCPPGGNITETWERCGEHALNTLGGIWRRQIHLNWFKNLAELQDCLMFCLVKNPQTRSDVVVIIDPRLSLINTFLLDLWTVTTKWSDELRREKLMKPPLVWGLSSSERIFYISVICIVAKRKILDCYLIVCLIYFSVQDVLLV